MNYRFTFFAFLFFTVTGYSQSQLEFDAGVKAGMNYSRINSSSVVAYNNGYYPSYHAGVYAMFKIDNFGIQTEAVYSVQGQTYRYVAQNNCNTVLNYINVPIILKAYVTSGLNLQAGPQFGFLMSAKDYVEHSVGNTLTINSQSINDYVRSHDVSVVLGMGYDFPFGLNITGRFNIGASNINYYSGSYLPNGTTTSFGTAKAFNQFFQLSAGYRLFKKEFESR
jgi:hypothetical protein